MNDLPPPSAASLDAPLDAVDLSLAYKVMIPSPLFFFSTQIPPEWFKSISLHAPATPPPQACALLRNGAIDSFPQQMQLFGGAKFVMTGGLSACQLCGTLRLSWVIYGWCDSSEFPEIEDDVISKNTFSDLQGKVSGKVVRQAFDSSKVISLIVVLVIICGNGRGEFWH